MLYSVYEDLVSELAHKEAVKDILYAQELEYSKVRSFELNTGEASQRVTQRGLDEVRREIGIIEKEIKQLRRRINGTNAIRHIIQRNG